jgi:hypothetical protein
VILRAFLARRSVLIGLGTGLRIIGSRYSLDTRRLGEFAARNRLPHRWIDLEHDTEAEALLRQAGISPHETPVVILRDQRVMRNPTTTDLARALGLHDLGPTDGLWDVIVVVEGPAGLAAAVGVGNSAGQAALFLSKPGIACLPSHPPRRHRQGHVALSRRPDRANTVDRGDAPHRGARAPRRWRARCDRGRRHTHGEQRELPATRLFVFIGADPHTA